MSFGTKASRQVAFFTLTTVLVSLGRQTCGVQQFPVLSLEFATAEWEHVLWVWISFGFLGDEFAYADAAPSKPVGTCEFGSVSTLHRGQPARDTDGSS